MKPKIAIVVGELAQPRFLTLFEPLKADFDPTVYALADDKQLAAHGTGLKLRVFENVCDMPGYMRGLEEELADARAIIGVETSRLATFQAVRAARKFGIPMGVVANEHIPYFYERFANIRAIQYDICTKATRFWPTSRAAYDCLRLEGVPETSIQMVAPAVDLARFRADSVGRRRMRDYVGFAESEVVVLFRHDLDPALRPQEILEAVALLKRQAVFRSGQLRILFAGDGPAARELKYRAYDLGLGRQALFLHQDAEPFLTDLYAASDIIIAPRIMRADCHEPLPLALLEAMACGAVPLAGSGTVAAELAGDGGVTFGGDGPGAIAAELAKLLADPGTLEVRRLTAARRAGQAFSPHVAAAPMIADLAALIGTGVGASAGLGSMLAAAREALSRGAVDDAIVKLEEADLVVNATDLMRAELCCLRGDVAYTRSDLNSATEHYAQALQLDDRHAAALRGLGMVSYQGHSDTEALTFFRKSLAIEDDDAHAKLGMGLTYKRLGLNEEALHWLERSLEHDKAPETALLALAQTCAQLNDPERGIEVLERVVEGIGEQHVFLVTLGQLYLAAGRFEQGNALLRKALGNGGPSTAA